MRTLEEIFDKCSPEPTSGCWLWTGAQVHGYAGIWLSTGGIVRVHRLVWTLVHGTIPKGQFVLHKCDVRGCVNPSHLELGDNAKNLEDARLRGRLIRRYCIKGHQFTVQTERFSKGHKVCRICDSVRKKAYYRRLRIRQGFVPPP